MKPHIAVALALTMAMIASSSRSDSKGMRKVLLPVDGSPLVTFRLQFRVGSINDPEGKAGLTALTASMITDGSSKSRDYDEIIEALYPMAADVNVLVDKEVTTIYGTVHRDHLDAYYQILMEMLREPRFGKEDFERVRTDQVNYLSNSLRSSNDEELGKEALNAFMYSGHPYGTPVEGLVTSVSGLTTDDVRDHYQRYFTRDNVTIGLAGGYDDALVARLEKDLSALPAGAAPAVELPAPAPIEGMPVIAVEKDTRATAISMGFPIDITRADPDFYALMVANSWLGEHRTFNGQLMIRMRQVRGLNYGDYSYIENFIQAGGSTFPRTNIPRRQQFFSIWIRPVQPEHRHYAIRLALWELEQLVRNGMTEEEFEATRQFLTNYSKLWAQDQNRRLGYQMDAAFYGTDDILAVLPERLAALTVDDVNDAIRRHLRFDDIRIAVVTSGADEFMNALASNAPSPISYETEMPEDVLSEDRLVSVYKLNINRADSRVVDVDDMFE